MEIKITGVQQNSLNVYINKKFVAKLDNDHLIVYVNMPESEFNRIYGTTEELNGALNDYLCQLTCNYDCFENYEIRFLEE